MIDDDLLREKLLRLKGYHAHKYPDLTLSQLLHKLCDSALEQEAVEECENCGSAYALETDHIYPRAKGGSSSR